MVLSFNEELCIVNDTCVGVPRHSEPDEGMGVTKISGEAALAVVGLEEAEAYPPEAIIQAWKRLRRDPARSSASKYSLLVVSR